MSRHVWTLTDVDRGVWVDHFVQNPGTLGLPGEQGWSIHKRVLHGGLCDGVDAIEVNNGDLSFVVVPTRGMGIWRGRYRACALGWNAPITGPVNPMFVDHTERGGLGWLAGFDELIVRCGLEWNGAPGTDIVPDNNGNPAEIALTLHGKIANLPAKYVEVEVIPGSPDKLVVRGTVEEGMLFGSRLVLETEISTEAGSNRMTIADTVRNAGDTSAEIELLYHCNFGRPFLDEGAKLVAPAVEIAPRDATAQRAVATHDTYAGPTPGFVEEVFWYAPKGGDAGNTLVLLRNAQGNKGVAVRYNLDELPCFTQWKNTAGERDGYVTGLEPGMNYPNVRTFERTKGRVKELAPGAVHAATLVIEAYDSAEGVATIEAEIAALQGDTAPVVHPDPQPQYSAV